MISTPRFPLRSFRFRYFCDFPDLVPIDFQGLLVATKGTNQEGGGAMVLSEHADWSYGPRSQPVGA